MTTASLADATDAYPHGRVYFLPIALVSLLLRTVAMFVMAGRRTPDWFFNQASELGCLAQSILSGHGLASPFGGSTGPSAFLAPGYPLLVALAFRTCGAYSTKAEALLIALQVVFGVITVLLLMLVARRVLGNQGANIAGLLCAVNPLLVCLPGMFWETSFSTMALVAVLALSLLCVDRTNNWNWIALGLTCALAMLVNPALMLSFAGIVTWAAWASRINPQRAILLTASAWLLLFAAWPVRNAIVMRQFIPLRSNLGYELWQGNRPGSDGNFDAALHPNTNRNEFDKYARLGEMDYMHGKYVLALTAIKANRSRFLQLSLTRAVRFWLGLGKATSAFVVISITFSGFLATLGLVMLFCWRRDTAMLLLMPLLLFPIPYYFTHADFRFRLVLEPIALLLETYFIQRGCAFLRTRLANAQATSQVSPAV